MEFKMISFICMAAIVLFLLFLVLNKVKLEKSNDDFFGVADTTAMRGLWCLIIVLVHIPIAYQNQIQDMIGSFAYIGVTFFFMTSGYGLKLGLMRHPESIGSFWKRRIPKLVIPYFIAILIYLFLFLLNKESIEPYLFYSVGGWVLWLIFCYFTFWAVNTIKLSERYKDIVISAVIILVSIVMFLCGNIISFTTWVTEIYGFIWGIWLANNNERFKEFAIRKWHAKVVVFCMLAALLGVLYLRYKTIYFIGNYILKILLGLAILVFILVLTSRIIIGNRTINFIGKISYEIFLCHGIAIKIVEMCFSHIESGLFIAMALIVSVIIATVVRAIANKWINIMFLKEIKNG
ncbi:acyltransferase family protein [Butyrivibrio sp. VCB2001]|uniref:acyltransferase family protein n=1 Tax=Butyrivibrio sp. VCB2001 TaxID=1280667 RepID=UPI0006870F0E|nr:acyltransferase [Butyrivibrio sp. VCB2001]